MFRWVMMAAAGVALGSAAPAADGTFKTKVNGSTYRVSVSNGYFEVAKKSIFVVGSVKLRDEMRAAVAGATGCTARDDMMVGNILQGKLECSAQ